MILGLSPILAINENNQNMVVQGNSSCFGQETAIVNQMKALMKSTTEIERQFDLIALRTVDFYENKILSQGVTIPNYNELVNNIQDKKDMIQAAQSTAQYNYETFNCTSGNPKLLVSQFRLNLLIVKRAIISYETSIRNLIVAVHLTSLSTVKNSQ